MIHIAYVDSATKKTAVNKWYKRFKEGRENIGETGAATAQ